MALSARFVLNQRRIVLLFAAGTLACAPAPREGETVHIAEESAIIIWDAATKTQHFIRRASFETKAKDFGFLVPTPTVPELAEVDDAAFELIKGLSEMQVKSLARAEPAPAAASASVQVLATARVAGYDAAVLAADDANALDQWLKTNGYASSPALLDWYKPYIERKWKITAFKVASDAGAARLETSAVRMSFKADAPFFPYREPKDPGTAQSGPRFLHVYYLGESRVQGKLGSENWAASTVWSRDIGANVDLLSQRLKLPLAELRATRLTRFTDQSVKRTTDEDLVFSASADQSEVMLGIAPGSVPKTGAAKSMSSGRRNNLILLVIFLAIGLIGAFAWWRISRKK